MAGKKEAIWTVSWQIHAGLTANFKHPLGTTKPEIAEKCVVKPTCAFTNNEVWHWTSLDTSSDNIHRDLKSFQDTQH